MYIKAFPAKMLIVRTATGGLSGYREDSGGGELFFIGADNRRSIAASEKRMM
jgi:hypothetical protein